MPLQITIPDEDIKYLNSEAQEELRLSIERHWKALLGEASRLEASTRSTKGNPQFTSSMISDADLLLRRGYRRPLKKRWFVIMQLVAPIAGIITGLVADRELLKQPEWLVAFVIVLAVTIAATVVVVLKE